MSLFAYMYLQDTEVGRLEGKLEEERSYTAKILDEVTIHMTYTMSSQMHVNLVKLYAPQPVFKASVQL